MCSSDLKMAEDGVSRALEVAGMPARPCMTGDLRVFGAIERGSAEWPEEEWLTVYGSEAASIRDLMRREPELARPLHPSLPHTAAALAWALEHEQARTVEDLLHRRTRMAFLREAAAGQVARDLAPLEIGRAHV